jgi:hypothetical protein
MLPRTQYEYDVASLLRDLALRDLDIERLQSRVRELEDERDGALDRMLQMEHDLEEADPGWRDDAISMLVKLVRDEFPGYSLEEIAFTWGPETSAAELAALARLDAQEATDAV